MFIHASCDSENVWIKDDVAGTEADFADKNVV